MSWCGVRLWCGLRARLMIELALVKRPLLLPFRYCPPARIALAARAALDIASMASAAFATSLSWSAATSGATSPGSRLSIWSFSLATLFLPPLPGGRRTAAWAWREKSRMMAPTCSAVALPHLDPASAHDCAGCSVGPVRSVEVLFGAWPCGQALGERWGLRGEGAVCGDKRGVSGVCETSVSSSSCSGLNDAPSVARRDASLGLCPRQAFTVVAVQVPLLGDPAKRTAQVAFSPLRGSQDLRQAEPGSGQVGEARGLIVPTVTFRTRASKLISKQLPVRAACGRARFWVGSRVAALFQ